MIELFPIVWLSCSFFMENQYPDEAKREEIANACNSVIQKPGTERLFSRCSKQLLRLSEFVLKRIDYLISRLMALLVIAYFSHWYSKNTQHLLFICYCFRVIENIWKHFCEQLFYRSTNCAKTKTYKLFFFLTDMKCRFTRTWTNQNTRFTCNSYICKIKVTCINFMTNVVLVEDPISTVVLPYSLDTIKPDFVYFITFQVVSYLSLSVWRHWRCTTGLPTVGRRWREERISVRAW